jgi:ribosomal protein S18 acetylase RimI-like enzyme
VDLVRKSRARDEFASPTIRPVEQRDLEAVRNVLVTTWHDTYDRALGCVRVAEIVDDWHSVPNLRAELDRLDHSFLLAEASGAIIATGSATRVDQTIAIERLYVQPQSQGRGLGAQLHARHIAAVGPAAKAVVEVLATNERAIAFYERHGFVRVGRSGDDVVMHRGLEAAHGR